MTEIKILTTPNCQACEVVERIIEKIKGDYADLEVKTIDVTEHPEVLQEYPIFSAPGIVINGKLEFAGGATEQDLRKKLKEK